MLGVAGLLVLAVAGVLAYRFAQPRWYYAQVTIGSPRPEGWRVVPQMPAFAPIGPFGQLEYLHKAEILSPVVDRLDLTRGYARGGERLKQHEAVSVLVASLRVEVDSVSPSLARIGVYDRDPQRAADIANTVAVVFRKQRIRDALPEYDEYERSLSSNTPPSEIQPAFSSLHDLRMETLIDREPVRIRQRAEPAERPEPWWRGDPRRQTGIQVN